ncbi:MAG: M20/M25/M40 family metallo-hydrolase, partial [Actinobacteria bacterium]|nr:M20/M25/M40 family metallo-hydrolase [Actinomycetota bacterium]
MLSYAMTVVAGARAARLTGARATFGKVAVEPNAANAVPGRVEAWLDARAPDQPSLDALVEEVARRAREHAARHGTDMQLVAESVSPTVRFDPVLRDRLTEALGGAPVLATAAGHDAGVLAAAGVPAGMLFVRNHTGVSHSPDEHADLADCLAGVEALAVVLATLAGPP